MDENSKFIILAIMTGVWPIVLDFIKKTWNKRREQKEENKLDSESNNLNSGSRLADAETDTEKAKKNEIYVTTIRQLMDEQRLVFDKQIQILMDGQSKMTQELSDIRLVNSELHEENKELKETIRGLRSVIKELKGLVKNLMQGIKILIEWFKRNEMEAPWEPVLTNKQEIVMKENYLDELDKDKYP